MPPGGTFNRVADAGNGSSYAILKDTAATLAGSRPVYLRATNLALQDSVKQALSGFVKAGGSLLLVMGEGMAGLFLGVPGAVRLSVEAENPKWCGKDFEVFMEEILRWLLAR